VKTAVQLVLPVLLDFSETINCEFVAAVFAQEKCLLVNIHVRPRPTASKHLKKLWKTDMCMVICRV